MNAGQSLESILIVYQNPEEGRRDSYDDWYTNVHIRDAMRLDGAIATQRFIAAEDQPVIDGRTVDAGYFAHTIYEWESAAKSVAGHNERVGSPLMEVTKDASFKDLRDYFFRPVFLSDGWSREAGFRRGNDVLTAPILPRAGDEQGFVEWFRDAHVPDTLALPGIGSVGLFSYHEAQSLPVAFRFPLVAVYGLSDRGAALAAWNARHAAGSDKDLAARAADYEIACWKARIPRLRAEEVANPPAAAAAEERRARETYADRFFTADEIAALLHEI